MKMKNIGAAVLALSFAFSFGACMETQATSRGDIAAISVKANGSNFQYWNEDAASFQALKDYVKDITSRKSKNYIPPEERVAVFDMDGTLLGERTPSYFEWMMYLHRVTDDPSYTPSEEDRAIADAVTGKSDATFTGDEIAQSQSRVFAGMTVPEYDDYVRQFMETEAAGMNGIKRGEEFYLPMAEVMSYLQANGFDVWVISGSDRAALRVLADGVLPVARDHFIGKDVQYVASGQGAADGNDYVFDQKSDVVVRGELLQRDVRMNKVAAIVREIGRQPVLAFGNSMGDASMFNYTIAKNKHKAMAFALLCDDTEDDRGNEDVAATMRAACEENGWTPVSMRDDWKTIYGYGVKAEGK